MNLVVQAICLEKIFQGKDDDKNEAKALKLVRNPK